MTLQEKNSREMYTEKRAFNNIQKVLFNTKNLYPLNGEKIEKKNIIFTACDIKMNAIGKKREGDDNIHEHIIKYEIRFIYPLTIVISSTSEMCWI